MKYIPVYFVLIISLISCSAEEVDGSHGTPRNMVLLQEIIQSGTSRGFTIQVLDWEDERIIETTRYQPFPGNDVRVKASLWTRSETEIVQYDGTGYQVSKVPGDGGMIGMKLKGRIYEFIDRSVPAHGASVRLYGHPSIHFTLPDGKQKWFTNRIEVQSVTPGPTGTPKQEIRLLAILTNISLPAYSTANPEKSYSELLRLFPKSSQQAAQGDTFGAP